MKTIGIVAHSAEGGALCFLTACRLGGFFHPSIVMSAVPMGLSMAGWESGDHSVVADNLSCGVRQVADAGADFFVCPDNTAHIVLDEIIDKLPLPGLHIADVVCSQIEERGWTSAALLGTKWTMNGPVYNRALAKRGIQRLVPEPLVQQRINSAIFDELCLGVVSHETSAVFVDAIQALRQEGAQCAILGCTEIPLVVSDANSPLPVLDSTRLLARAAVLAAQRDGQLPKRGWLGSEWWR